LYKPLDLAKVHCERLEFAFDANLTDPLRTVVLTSSHHHGEANVPRFAVYGSTYRLGGLPYAISAEILAPNNQCHFEFNYIQRDVPRPPKGFRSVRILADALRNIPEPIAVECDAYFVYHEDSGRTSLLEIPVPIRSDVESPIFTHITAIRLANPSTGYSLQIRRGTSGELRHWVSFTWQATTLAGLPQMLLDESARLSQSLLRLPEDRINGS
jgi:hypothetical protein